ncbi:MAG: hypothetical protein M1816_002784 [Peltula sp. TS41687]|nr:MAG: hypothetical protein M1816_002784 [Peltula sp. TS41687]
MPVFYGVLALALFSISTWAAIVPVNVRPSRSGLAARDAPRPEELLRPTHEVELLYADEAAMGPPMLVTVTAKHDERPYVLLERFEDMLSSITCSTGPGSNNSTVLSMTFRDEQTLAQAEQEWSTKEELTFVTHHDTCNHDVKQREVYQSYSIRFDHDANMAIVACARKEFGYTTDANTALRIQGGTAPRHLARRLSPRTLGKDKSSLKKRAPRSFGFSLERKWAPVEDIGLIPGQLETYCRDCSSSGAVSIGYDFSFASLSTERLLALKEPFRNGGMGKPADAVFDTARMSIEVTEPIDVKSTLNVVAHSGVSVRWPGLIKKTSSKKVLGDRILPDRDNELFTIGGLQFVNWIGWGVLGIGWIGGAIDITHESRMTIPAGQSATIDFLNAGASSCTIKPTRTASTRVNKAEAALALEIAMGVAADLTVKVKVPGMNWNAMRYGGGRGPIGYKDGQISWYGGGFLDAPGIGTEIDSPARLDENCRPSETQWAYKVMTKFLYGLAGYASWAMYLPGMVIPRIDAFPIHPGPPLYNAIPLTEQCIVTSGKPKGPSFSINDDIRFPMSPPATLPDENTNEQSLDLGFDEPPKQSPIRPKVTRPQSPEQPLDPGFNEPKKQSPIRPKVTRPKPPARHPAPPKEQSPAAKIDDQTTPAWSARLTNDDREE